MLYFCSFMAGVILGNIMLLFFMGANKLNDRK